MPEEILTLTDEQIVVIRTTESGTSPTMRKTIGPDDVDDSGDDSTGENDPDPA